VTVVRISKGSFDVGDFHHARSLLRDSENALLEVLVELPGLIHYYVGVDAEKGYLTNVSVWDTLEHAQQMDILPEMLAQRPILEAAGVAFEAISNHQVIWAITA
jgi:hypothetical protein